MFDASVKWVVKPLMFLVHSQTVLPIVCVQTFHSMQMHLHKLSACSTFGISFSLPLIFGKSFFRLFTIDAPIWRSVFLEGSRWRGARN